MNSGPLAIWAAAVVTILPMHVFAQREHMAMLTFLPALAVYAMRSNREPLPLWAILIAGVGAGITLAFKPFFTVPAALCILFAAIRSRSWRTLFAPENIITAVLVLMVSVGTYIFYPEYFTVTYPLVRDTYLSWSMPLSVIFLNDATLIFAIAMVSVLLARQKRAPDSAVAGDGARIDRICRLVLPAAARLGLSLLSDGRGGLAGDGLRADGSGGADRARAVVEAVSAFVLAVTFVVGMLWFNATVYVGPVRQAVEGLMPHPRILVLSGEAAIGHPLVRDINGVWVSRQENLWIREFVRLTRERTVCRCGDRCQAERLSGAGAQMADRGFQEAAA